MSAPTRPLITTIIPTYRRPVLLRRAIESALEQGGPEVMVRVFDNASGDETADLVTAIAARDPRLVYHRHETNIGAIGNFEFGLRHVDTPYFSFLSDDDYLLPDFYRHALHELGDQTEVMFWAGMTLNVDESGKIWYARVDEWRREGLFAPPEGLMALMHGMAPVWTGIVFRREILDRIGFPDPEVQGPLDFDFLVRAAGRCSYIVRKHPSAVLTLHGASFSESQPLSSFWPGWQKMFRNMQTDEALSSDARANALRALHEDARRMLFRRGAYALCTGRYDYCREAAVILKTFYGMGTQSTMLRVLAAAWEKAPWFQRMYAAAYRWLERRLIASRSGLDRRYGYLIRRP